MVEDVERRIEELETGLRDVEGKARGARNRTLILQKAVEALVKDEALAESTRKALNDVIEELR